MMSQIQVACLVAGAISTFSLAAEPQPSDSRQEVPGQFPATLVDRFRKMLDMQVTVQRGTARLSEVDVGNPAKKVREEDPRTAVALSANEKDIIVEATNAIELVEAEGSAVAFAKALRELREDTLHVQRRLEISDLGMDTQGIEQEIIDTLKEIIEALGTH
jgi:hypothetical protein